MSAASLARRMADAGASAELIAIAIEEMEALELSLNARRIADRDRKRSQRERRKTANVTGQSEDSHGTVTDQVSLDKKDPQTPKELNPSRVCEARARFAPPDGVSDEQWAAFRKQRKKPINERSYALLTNKLQSLAEAGWPPGEMIDLAIERGWETVFEPRNDNGRWKPLGRHQPADGLSSTARAALQVFGR
jgi:hypothetical protein